MVDLIEKNYPNLSTERRGVKPSQAEQAANLMERTAGLIKCLDRQVPAFLAGVQLGLIYKRLQKMEEEFGITPEYIETPEDRLN